MRAIDLRIWGLNPSGADIEPDGRYVRFLFQLERDKLVGDDQVAGLFARMPLLEEVDALRRLGGDTSKLAEIGSLAELTARRDAAPDLVGAKVCRAPQPGGVDTIG